MRDSRRRIDQKRKISWRKGEQLIKKSLLKFTALKIWNCKATNMRLIESFSVRTNEVLILLDGTSYNTTRGI